MTAMKRVAVLWMLIAALSIWLARDTMAEVVLVDSEFLAYMAQAGEKVKPTKDSRVSKYCTCDGFNVGQVQFDFPQAQAASFAASARENFVKLDSTNWRPDLFNAGVLVKVVSRKTDLELLWQLDRIVCVLPGDSLVEPLLTVLDTVVVSNLLGAKGTATDIQAMFSNQIFNLKQDLAFYVFTNRGRSDPIKISAKDLAKRR